MWYTIFSANTKRSNKGMIRMAYNLNEINQRANSDPKGFVDECDDMYRRKVVRAADMICKNMNRSPIVLLSGPSGSGKTTTALKIGDELESRGVLTHTIQIDNYYMSPNPETSPKTPEGDYDLESPYCLDLELIKEHFNSLSRGETVLVPKYEFSRQARAVDQSKPLHLGKDEIAIFEGIHALNSILTDINPDAFKLYISARSNILSDLSVCFKGTWMRLMRRMVRDELFRGADCGVTLAMWANVRRGEKHYISPFKDQADLKFDSSLPYEVPVLKSHASALFDKAKDSIERFDEILRIPRALEMFAEIDSELLSKHSLIREFIGGGVYDY